MKTARDLRSRLTVLTTSLLALPLDERFSTLVRDARQQISDPENQRSILSLRDRIKRQVRDVFQVALDTGEIRVDVPIKLLVGVYMGMLRESSGPSASQ